MTIDGVRRMPLLTKLSTEDAVASYFRAAPREGRRLRLQRQLRLLWLPLPLLPLLLRELRREPLRELRLRDGIEVRRCAW